MLHKKRFSSLEELYTHWDVPQWENFNFAYDVVDHMAASTPEANAMVHIDDDLVRRDYTFAFFAAASSRLAHALAAQGIAKGDRVMLMLNRRVEFWISMLALHRLGAVAVPSPSMLTSKDIEFRVNFAGITGAIIEDTLVERMETARARCPDLEVLIHTGAVAQKTGWIAYDQVQNDQPETYSRPEDAAADSDPLLIFFSSGTTGPPKMVEHTHRYPVGHIITGMYWHDLEPGDLHLTLADTGWGKAVWGKFYGQWMAGASIFVYDFRGKFDPHKLLSVLSEHKVTSFCAPPTVYRFLVRQDLSGYDLSALRHCTTAGELLNEGVFLKWREKTGLPIYEGYGQTETTLQIATFPFMTPKPGSIGKATPQWDVVLLDSDGQQCPPGVEGEICIRIDPREPEGLFTGYLDEPEKTKAVKTDGHYHTGDKAWMDEDGYFWFLGRVDDLIKSSGYRIGPFEVESALITHPGVVEAAVTAVSDDIRGQAVKATVVLAQGYIPSDALSKELQDHVKQVTAPYKYPRIIDYVADLPKTISGKIKRAEIRARDGANAV
mgnify:CR=1 FL=1